MKKRQAVVLVGDINKTTLKGTEAIAYLLEYESAELITLTRQPGRDSLGATGKYVWVSEGEPTP